MWQSILRCRKLLRRGCIWIIGNGQSIFFWQDNWIDTRSLLDILDIDEHASVDLDLKVSDFIENKQWNAQKLNASLHSPTIVQKILGLPIPLSDIPDSICWELSSSGAFTTKSATWLAHDNAQEEPSWPFKGIWHLDIMPKIQIFLWQMCHNALPVTGNFIHTRMSATQLDPQCPLCATDIESIDHLFQGCPHTLSIWDLAKQHRWIPLQFTPNTTFPWLTQWGSCLATYDKKILQRIAFLLWSMWKMRNAVIFQQKVVQPIKCLTRAKKLCAEWRIRTCMSVDHLTKGSSFPPSNKTLFIRRQPPTPGTVKLNFDGSLQGNSAAGGFIIQDWRGEILVMGASNYGDTSVILAESRALRDGLVAALNYDFYNLEVEGGNSMVVGAFNKEIEVPWCIKTTIQDIQVLARQAQVIKVKHIYREANMVADWLSKFGHSITDTWLSNHCESRDLRSIVQDDRIGRTLVRRGN